MPGIKHVCLSAAVLFPMAAYGSFGGTPCKDFACFFLIWGGLLGVAGGIPVSALIFIVLHFRFCNPARSRVNQLILGGFLGVVAFEISAACASLMSVWGKNPWIGLVSAFVVLAIASARYAGSSPSSERASTAP